MRCTMWMVVGLALGCSRQGDDRLRDLASKANPVIQRLHDPAAIVLDPEKRSDIQAVSSACLAGIETAKALATIHFNDAAAGPNGQIGVDDVMFMFQHDTHNYCVAGHFDADCVQFCVQRYDELAKAIDRVREQAVKQDVRIESLHK